MKNKAQTIERLREILYQLEELGNEASDLVESISERSARVGEAYGAFKFGFSDNPHDTTLESIVDELTEIEEQ